MLNAVRIWILLSTLLVSAGWVLSAFHELNRAGYSVIFALAAIGLVFWLRGTGSHSKINPAQLLRKFKRRFKRPAPFIFLALTIMSFISGWLYAPFNSDTNAYRIPRVLHWLGRQQWHWIDTVDMRMNVAACGYEWMMTPIVLFTRTDRFLFLINWIPYLMLPGLVFCVLRFSGVSARVAWWWSWLLASGWCYVMQSASVTNDAFAVTYALASVALALKARENLDTSDLLISLLAAALATGVKQTNMPLAILWGIAALPQWRLARARPATAFAAVALGFLVSAAPIAILNFKHTGDWSGVSAITGQYSQWHIRLNSPLWGIIGNAFCLPLQNIEPPFFPLSGAWNGLMERFVRTPFGAHFQSFEDFGALSPGISEASAGIGLAIVVMAAISVWAAIRFRGRLSARGHSVVQRALRLTPWLLLIIFMAKDGEAQNARHLASYYVFLFPAVLVAGGQELLTRRLWWQRTALICMATAAGLLVVNSSRPLFPATTLLTRLAAAHPGSKSIAVLQRAYTGPAGFENLKSNLAGRLPVGETILGFAGSGNCESEPILWEPFGSRSVEWVLPRDTPEQLRQRGIHFVVIENDPGPGSPPLDEWLARYHAHLIAAIPYQRNGHFNASSHIYITRLDGP